MKWRTSHEESHHHAAMNRANQNFTSILYTVAREQEHKLVFYEHEDYLGIGLLDCTRNQCKWIDGARKKVTDDMVTNGFSFIGDEVPLFLGIFEMQESTGWK